MNTQTLKFNTFILSVCLLVSGCFSTEYNLATNKEETLMIGTEKEEKVGDAVSQQLERQVKIATEFDLNQRVQRILNRLAPVADRKDIVYTIKVIDEDELNAVSLPGGYIYVYRELMDKLKDDDALAGVIAHELGHITAKHAIKRMQAAYGATILQIMAGVSGSGELAQGVNLMLATVFSSYSRQDEFEADRLAVKYTRKAGYKPEAMLTVMEELKKENEKTRHPVSLLRTHPYLNERRAALNKEITGKIGFEDYLNLTGNESRF